MIRRSSLVFALFVLLPVALLVACSAPLSELTSEKSTNSLSVAENQTITLVYAVHWLEDNQINGIYENGVLKSKGLRQYLDEYESLNPGVTFEIRQVPYSEYPGKLKVFHDTDTVPDIYQIYSAWGVSLVKDHVLADPPQYVKDDITKNYISTSGVTIDNNIWGIPTEVNTYALVYNKQMFIDVGITDDAGNALPPKTWNELTDDAVRLAVRDNGGRFSRYGFAFIKGLDWGVVDPFLALLFSNGGSYLSRDLRSAAFNDSAGVEALAAQKKLFDSYVTTLNAVVWDFKDKKAAMIIVPPWTKQGLREGFNETFYRDVGVAPVPYMKKPATLQYSWFMGVMEKSRNKEEAWKFLHWFSSDVQPATNTTRYGDLLVNTIGAIPSRNIDRANHYAVLNDPFTKVFVQELVNSVPEPNVLSSNKIKEVLMNHIQAAWVGDAEIKTALDDAAEEVNRILASN